MTNPLYKRKAPDNRVNCYLCSCGHITKTIDIHNGVTPMFFDCEVCSSPANSTFYNDVAPEQKPTVEWFRPNLKQILKMRKKPSLLDHILNGGLEYRRINQPNKKTKQFSITLLIAVLLSVCFYGCETNVKSETTKDLIDGVEVEIVTIDSCEYIHIRGGNASWGSHKGNCKYCAKRNKK